MPQLDSVIFSVELNSLSILLVLFLFFIPKFVNHLKNIILIRLLNLFILNKEKVDVSESKSIVISDSIQLFFNDFFFDLNQLFLNLDYTQNSKLVDKLTYEEDFFFRYSLLQIFKA